MGRRAMVRLLNDPEDARAYCIWIVKEVGKAVTAFRPGDAVILSYSSCFTCKQCLAAANPYCTRIDVLNFSGHRPDGAQAVKDASGKPLSSFFFGQSSMSKFILAYENSAVKVNTTRDELKMFPPLSCGIQTGAGAVINVLKPRPHASFLIFGGGAVGLAACLAANLYSPANLIFVDNA